MWSRIRFFSCFRATLTSWVFTLTKNQMKKHQKEYRQFLAEIGPEAFKRPMLTHRNAITTCWKRVGRVSRDNTKARDSILEEDLAKNVSLSLYNSFYLNRESKVKSLPNQTKRLQEQREWVRACACVPSERDKRETHELSVRQRTHRVFGTEGNKPGTARTQNPPEYQQSGEDPASQSTSYNNIVARTSPRFECVGFFVADSGLAHLGQLITRAGDVEKNPGPTLCGECRKKVTSNSVKCTWCEQWIHQGCSGLSRQEILQLAKANRYAFECTKCSSALSNPNREFPEVETRGEKPCENPAQEPKEANGTDTREPREQAPWPHLDQESAEGEPRGTNTCDNPAQGPTLTNELPQREEPKSPCLHPGQEPEEEETRGIDSCENPAQHLLRQKDSDKGEKIRRGKMRRPTEEHREARRQKRRQRRLPTPPEGQPSITVTAWNLQGLSVHERNRNRLKRVITYAQGKRWEIILISELRSKSKGVIWLGEDSEQTVVIHS